MPRVGVDDWVAQADDRAERATGVRGAVERRWSSIPPLLRLAPFVIAAACLPYLTDSEYVTRVALDTLLFILLAMALNISVGWAGMLDLGFVAFYGFGAYTYAALSSEHFGVHLPTLAAIPIVVVLSIGLGFLLGLPSRRLAGDYLAIVTLFFSQIFVLLTTNGNRITFPGESQPTDITGGPNGIADLDQFEILAVSFDGLESYYWFALLSAVVVGIMLWIVNESRTGRAWRSFREDALAAEILSVPVDRLRLYAFAFGSAIAGFTGTIFAAVQTAAFPSNFDIPLLITIYAMVILGGAGSLVGVAVGAITINTIFEVLSTPDQARYAFYAAVILALLVYLRPWWRLAIVAGGTIGLGFALHAIADAVRPAWTSGTLEGGWVADLLQPWVLYPAFPERMGQYAFVAAVAGAIVLSIWRSFWGTTILLIPTLYLGAVAWETILVVNPSVTRLILLGATLVVLMNRRPEGLLGQKRVEIV